MDKLCPVCHSQLEKWTDDPILTIKGLAGEDYKGLLFFNANHITELQEERKQQEIDIDLPEADRTTFTEFIEGFIFISKQIINELRESTEKILGLTGNISQEQKNKILKDYFNNDDNGNYIGTYEYGLKLEDKVEWTDVKRIGPINKSHLPEEIKKLKAIHIEDLRHPIPIYKLGILSDESWEWNTPDGWIEEYYADYYIYNQNRINTSLDYGKIRDKTILPLSTVEGSLKTADLKYVWTLVEWGTGPYWKRKIIGHSWDGSSNKSISIHYSIYYSTIHGIFSDGTYLWIIAKDHSAMPGHTHDYRVYKVTISDLTMAQVGILPSPGGVPGNNYELPRILSMDLKYFYVLSTYIDIAGTTSGSYKRIEKVNKNTFIVESFLDIPIDLNKTTIDNLPYSPFFPTQGHQLYNIKIVPHKRVQGDTIWYFDWQHSQIPNQYPEFLLYIEDWNLLCSDDEYIYLDRQLDERKYGLINERPSYYGGLEWDFGIESQITKEHTIIKISKRTLGKITFKNTLEIVEDFSSYYLRSATIDNNFIYFLCYNGYGEERDPGTDVGTYDYGGIVDKRNIPLKLALGFLKIYDKQGTLIKTYNQDIGEISNSIIGRPNFSFSDYEKEYDIEDMDILRFRVSIINSDQAIFGKNLLTYTITATAGTGGTISPSGEVAITDNENQSFTIIANTGFQIADVLVDGVSKGVVFNYTFSNVTANHTISAFFVPLLP